MASVDDPRQPLIDPSTSGGSSNIRYTEESLPSTIINMPINPIPSKKNKASRNKNRRREKLNKRRSTVKDMFTVNMSRRLASIQEIKKKMSRLNDIMCILALVGILLMITVNEIIFHQINNTETVLSWSFRLIMTITTIILVGLVILYHRLDLTLYALKNFTDDWRVGLTYKKIFIVSLEVLICAIHPVVRSFPDHSNSTAENSSTLTITPDVQSLSYVSIDVALGLPMFLRLYLIPRTILYHSYLALHAGSQSIGYLSQVTIDFYFLMKTYLDRWPILCLSIFCCTAFFIGSWSLRACDYTSYDVHLPMLDAMWLFIVTYTTVGYGDIVPSSYCGRSIVLIIASTGLFSSALLISVVGQKLMLSRGEKYVHIFTLNTQLEKKHKHEAANIVKYAMKLWISKHNNKEIPNTQRIEYRKKLFKSLHIIHQIKKEQRGLMDNSVGFPEIAALQNTTNSNTDDTIEKIEDLEFKIDNVEEQLADVKQSIGNMQNTLNLLVDIVRR